MDVGRIRLVGTRCPAQGGVEYRLSWATTFPILKLRIKSFKFCSCVGGDEQPADVLVGSMASILFPSPTLRAWGDVLQWGEWSFFTRPPSRPKHFRIDGMSHRVLVPVTNPLGGIRTYMLYNMKHLHDAGFRFTFLSERGAAFDLFKKDVENWADTEFVESPGNGALTTIRSIRTALERGRFDLIHSQGLFAGTVAAAANYFRRIPHLITLHDVIVPLNDVPGRFKTLKKAVSAFVTRRATVIIPVSKDCEMNHRSVFPSWNRGPVRIQTISNGIDIERILHSRTAFESNPAAATLRGELDIAPDVVLGGFFGRFMPQKGFEYLIDALAILDKNGYGDRFRLVATADLHGYQQEYISAVKQRPEVARMVHFVPAVGDITPLLCQVDALVMPSLWEACCLLPMEAMVLGVPVIGSDCIGLREVIADTPSFVPKHADAESLAETLMAFTDNPDQVSAKRFAEAAQRRFDVRPAVDELLKLYLGNVK